MAKNNSVNNYNSYAYVIEKEKDGRIYENLVIEIHLNNGDVVNEIFNLRFFNSKLDYKIKKNLDVVKGGK